MPEHDVVALFGGTFDPVHNGHLYPLQELATQFNWSQVQLLPTYLPPYKTQPIASDQQRIDMLRLATESDSRFVVNTWEIDNKQPSRTKHVLLDLKRKNPQQTICFVIGMDSFTQLDSWLEWQSLFQHCHFVVVPRPGYSKDQLSPELQRFCEPRYRHSVSDFLIGSGCVYLAETQAVDCASTLLRNQLRTTERCPEHLPQPVWQYIRQYNLYR